MTIEVLDFERNTIEDVLEEVQRNRHLVIHVHEHQLKQIENWDDNHPLNKNATHRQAFLDLFK